MMKQFVDWKIVVTAIVAVALLTGVALSLGYNGLLLTAVIAAIVGLAGWTLPQLRTA